MDILTVLHDWLPLYSPILTGIVGWLAKSFVDHATKDRADHATGGTHMGWTRPSGRPAATGNA